MEAKKNPKVDLRRKSSLYFLIGLCIALFVSWRAIEYREYEKRASTLEQIDLDLEEEEDVEIIENLEVPPPKPPPPPAVIEVVKDDEDVEELEIEETDVEEEEELEINEIEEVEEVEDNTEYNFKVVEDQPIYPGCENVSKNQREACFGKKIRSDIARLLNRKLDSDRAGRGGRSFVGFTISKTGKITNIHVARSPNEYLKKLSIDIMSSLPKLTPAKQRGKPVNVTYSVPITVKIEE